MTGMLSDHELSQLAPAESCPHTTPIPTQMVSSDEYYPMPQNARQRASLILFRNSKPTGLRINAASTRNIAI